MDFDWRRKKENKLKRRSQTPGSTKSENCKCTPMDKFFAKTSRSYKHKGYAGWCLKMADKRKRFGG